MPRPGILQLTEKSKSKVHRLQFRADLDADGEEGFLRARVCELDAVDKIGLIIASGGLLEPQRKAVISSWSHNAVGHMRTTHPVGVGVVFEAGKFLIAEGHFNMEMHAGQDAYRAVKMLDKEGLAEFSIMMIVLDEDWQHRDDGDYYPVVTKYDVGEWSACLEGVSYNTGVEEMRAAGSDEAKSNPRRNDTEQRLAALRIRQLTAGRKA